MLSNWLQKKQNEVLSSTRERRKSPSSCYSAWIMWWGGRVMWYGTNNFMFQLNTFLTPAGTLAGFCRPPVSQPQEKERRCPVPVKCHPRPSSDWLSFCISEASTSHLLRWDPCPDANEKAWVLVTPLSPPCGNCKRHDHKADTDPVWCLHSPEHLVRSMKYVQSCTVLHQSPCDRARGGILAPFIMRKLWRAELSQDQTVITTGGSNPGLSFSLLHFK